MKLSTATIQASIAQGGAVLGPRVAAPFCTPRPASGAEVNGEKSGLGEASVAWAMRSAAKPS